MSKTHSATWKITGKGKTRAYYATVKAHTAQPGDSVKVTGKSGAVTIGRLIEVAETADGLEHWSFDNLNTAADKARNRAINAASQSDYWSSPAGIATMARRDAANLKRATAAVVAPVKTAATPEAPAAPVAAVDPAILAALIAAGATPELIAATVAAMVGTVAAVPPAAVVAPVKTRKLPGLHARKIPAATIHAAMASTPDILAVCDSCNRERKGCATHEGAPELKTCPRCSSLDADTARVRASRHN